MKVNDRTTMRELKILRRALAAQVAGPAAPVAVAGEPCAQVVRLVHECALQHRADGGGVIVNLGSISWHLALEELTLYQTCKAGIEGLTRSFARELGPDNIRSVCIVPGNVKTPRQMKWYTPEGEAEIVAAQCLKGRLVPDDIAAMALFLASDDARLVTGHEYFVDAGWR